MVDTNVLPGNGRAKSPLQEHIEKRNLESVDPGASIKTVAPNFSQFPVPHVLSFQGLFSNFAQVYRRSDEALRHSEENARYMRNDCGIMECIEARQRMTALLPWHLEPEDEHSPQQKVLCGELTKLLERIVRFTEYRMNLLHAIWYGKYAVQNRYGWANIQGKMRVLPIPGRDEHPGWLPVNGDKIVYRYDDGTLEKKKGVVGIRTGYRYKEGQVLHGQWEVEVTDRGLAYFIPPWQRSLLVIHKHMIEDGAWERPEDASMIHGVGIRSRIYWDWFQKQESLAFLMEYLERSAGGIEIWEYPAGNDEAKKAARKAAEERIANSRNVILFPKPMGEDAAYFDVRHVEPGMAGIESLKDLLTNYYGHRIKRYILGQTLSSEADATGLGSGLAELHLDTLLQIVRYDAGNLEDTLTHELVEPLKRFNFPDANNILVRFRIETEAPDVEKRLEAYARAWEMGAKLKESDIMDIIGAAMPEPDDKVLEKSAMEGAGQAGGVFSGFGGGPAGPGGNGQPVPVPDEESVAAEAMQNLFGDAADNKGGSITYASEDGKWVQRELPLFDTGERKKQVYAAEIEASPSAEIERAASETDTNPSDEQKEAGNYRKGKCNLHGMRIAIENPRGSIRSGDDWQVEMPHHYGYILKTESEADGDHVDCFIGPDPESEVVFVVDQQNQQGKFDEHKAMLGWKDVASAREGYMDSYSEGWKGPKDITPMTVDQFKAWLDDGDSSKPIAEQVSRYSHVEHNTVRFGNDGASLTDRFNTAIERYARKRPIVQSWKLPVAFYMAANQDMDEGIARDFHRGLVRSALDRGEPVPRRVLLAYPELVENDT